MVIQSTEDQPFTSIDLTTRSSETDHAQALYLFKVISHGGNKRDFNKVNACHFLIIMAGFACTLPYIQPARQFAKNNHILGWIFAASEVLALGTLSSWLLKDVILHIQYRAIVNPQHNFRSLKYTIIPLILAMLTSLPSTIIGYVYNNRSFFLAAIAFFGDLVSNTYTFNNIFKNINHYLLRNAPTNQHRFRKRLIENANSTIHYFLQLPDYQFDEFLQANNISSIINTTTNNTGLTIDVLKNIFSRNDTIGSNKTNQLTVQAKRAVFFLSIILPINWFPTAFKLVFTTAYQITLMKVTSIALALVSSIPVYLLEHLFCHKIITGCLKFMPFFNSQHQSDSFSLTYYKKSFTVMTIFGLMVACLSFPTRALVIDETYKDGLYKKIILPWVCIMICLYKAYTIINCIPLFIENYATYGQNNRTVTKAKLLMIIKSYIKLIDEVNDSQLQLIGRSLDIRNDNNEDISPFTLDTGSMNLFSGSGIFSISSNPLNNLPSITHNPINMSEC